MNHRDESFSPETVNEQIDQLLRTSPLREDTSPAQMVQLLQGIYEEDSRLQRVWERLADHLTTTRPTGEAGEKQPLSSERFQQTSSSTIVRFPQEKVGVMQTHTRAPEHPRKRNSFQQRLGLLVAVILMAVLVGSLVTVLQLARQKPSGQTGTHQDGSTPGHIIYSTPATNEGANYPVWSADGQRVAVAGNPTLIWDATTGQHRVTVPLNLSESVTASPAWSPTSDLLAIPTNDRVVIVNGQSGKIVTSYPAPPLASTSTGALSTTFTTSSPGKTYLATLFPLGGAPRFGNVAWSPDGKWIATTFSSASSAGMVQVWNPQTGQLSFTLAKEAGAGFDAVSWSPDGQYIAANKWIWTGTFHQIDVWSVNTHQIVFQQSGNQQFSGSSWQPGSHNLASALLIPGSNSSLPGPPTYPTAVPTYNTAVLKIWNVTTKQLIKSFPGVNSISWSPNGKEFAYDNMVGGGATAGVTILDVNSGQKVYTYRVSASSKGQSVNLSTPSWSPDGKYIVTIEYRQTPAFQQATPVPTQQLQQPSAVVQVWVA